MTAIQDNGVKPFNMTVTNAETYYEGELVMVSSNALTIITADESIAIGVVDQDTIDSEQAARAVVTGDKIGIWPLGCGAIVQVRSENAAVYPQGALVVCADAVDGACNVTASSTGDNLIGTYMGDGETVSTANALIPVLLNVMPDIADHS